MGKFTICFIFINILNVIKMDTNDVYDNNDMQIDLRSVMATMKSLLNDVQKLEKKQRAMERRFINIPTDRNAKEKLSEQENITSELSLQLENFKETIEVVSNHSDERLEILEKKLSTIDMKSDITEERINLMNSSMSSLILSSDRKVSFSVQFKPPEGYSALVYPKLKSIIFRIVDYNDGEGYNETTGIFTVPVAGVYQFIFFVQGWHLAEKFTCPDAIVALFVDGITKAAAVADPRQDRQFATGGNTYISYLSQGQRVQIGTASTCEQYVIFGYRTSFSGHLLY